MEQLNADQGRIENVQRCKYCQEPMATDKLAAHIVREHGSRAEDIQLRKDDARQPRP